jgi:hypothetical protein
VKVFISWSGPRSKAVAQALHDWLPDVMQAIRPWISSEDIRKGKQWNLELTQELEGTHIGVICLTPENLMAPWILFEAGALSKLQRKDVYVCTYLIDLRHTDVTGPLAEFQHTLATKEDTHQLIKTINDAMAEGQGRLAEAPLDRAFERCWPELQQKLETLPKPEEPAAPPRAPDDMLREILEIVRDLAKPPPALLASARPETLREAWTDAQRQARQGKLSSFGQPMRGHRRIAIQATEKQVRDFCDLLEPMVNDYADIRPPLPTERALGVSDISQWEIDLSFPFPQGQIADEESLIQDAATKAGVNVMSVRPLIK